MRGGFRYRPKAALGLPSAEPLTIACRRPSRVSAPMPPMGGIKAVATDI
jgi:hypothetical protein